MKGYTLEKAKGEIPGMRKVMQYAEEHADVIMDNQAVYMGLHSFGPEMAKATKDKLVTAHMHLVEKFLSEFPYQTDTSQDMEDLLAEGYKIVTECAEVWDPQRGEFATLVTVHLMKLFRTFWKQISPIPQTSIQQYNRVKEYDRSCIQNYGEVMEPKEAAEALGYTVRKVSRAREYSNRMIYTYIDSYKYDSSQRSAEEEALQPIMDGDFMAAARRALEKRKEVAVFRDFLFSDEDNFQAYANKRGRTYQQAYREKERAIIILVAKEILSTDMLDSRTARVVEEKARAWKEYDRKSRLHWASELFPV